MANDLTCQEGSRSLSNLQMDHPLDVLYRVNPEIASLAYANRENWLTPEIMPQIAQFREYQMHEKIALLDFIVERSAIDSNERIQMEAQRTMEAIAQIEQDGAVRVETIRTDGMVEAQRIRYNSETEMVRIQSRAAVDIRKIECDTDTTISLAALDVQKMKYEIDVKMMQEHIAGQRYLSDNQLKATCIEAEALRDAIIFSETARAMSEDKKTEAQLRQAIHQAETTFMARMYEAEMMRQDHHDERIARITETYIITQGQIMRDSILAKIEATRIKGEAEKESYRTIESIARSALELSDSKRTAVRGASKYGRIEVVVERDDK
ncbi:MAG: hypothetical protein V2A62_01425 [Candidatus Woesearchaeota archaeon]